MARVVGLGLLITLSYIAQALVLAHLLATVIQNPGVAQTLPSMGMLLLIVCIRAVLAFGGEVTAGEAAQTSTQILRERMLNTLLRLGPGAIAGRRTGEVQSAIVSGVEALEAYYSQYMPSVFVALLGCAAVLGVTAWFDPFSAAVLTVFVMATPLADHLWIRWRRDKSAGIFAAMGAFGAYLLDSLQGIITLKAFDATQRRREALAERAATLRREAMNTLMVNLFRSGLIAGVTLGGAATIIFMNAARYAEGTIGLMALFATMFLAREVFRPVERLARAAHAAWSAHAAIGPVSRVLDATPLIVEASTPVRIASRATIEFEKVTFHYPESPTAALDSVSFSVDENEAVAIVGPSGAGKSTIAGLLQRFFDPASGVIRIGGQDIRTLSLADLRSLIAVVSQDTYLFHGSIADNLRMARPNASLIDLRTAARAASIDDFIVSLPEGYETSVGERGAQLSGGQRQRIAIARALLKRAPILLLDEATSSVDVATEQSIQAALQSLMRNQTTLIIAHRLSTVREADRIVVLDRGRMSEVGEHRTLVKAGGLYARLAAAQGEIA